MEIDSPNSVLSRCSRVHFKGGGYDRFRHTSRPAQGINTTMIEKTGASYAGLEEGDRFIVLIIKLSPFSWHLG